MTTDKQKKIVKEITGNELVYKVDDVGHGEQRGWWCGNHFIGQKDAIDYYVDEIKEKSLTPM